MKTRSGLLVFTCLTAIVFLAPPARAEITARDLRMEMTTRWDYQPGQGARVPAKDRDYFRRAQQPAEQQTEAPVIQSVDAPVIQSVEDAPVIQSVDRTPPPVVYGDWRNDPPPIEDRLPPPPPPKNPMITQTAVEAGLQLSSYHYHEKDLGVKTQGPEYGINVLGTAELGDYWFLRGEGRFVGGRIDYKGSGEIKDHPNYIAEVRAAVGRDLVWGNFALSPYVGIGYRYLHNDPRGRSTTGLYGYVRRSQYLFAPIGVQPRMMFPNGDRLVWTAEFDPLIRGWQDSLLSTLPGYPDLHNVQHKGYGVHSDLMYNRNAWSFGPFVNYWNINQSSVACGTGTYWIVCGVEPHNHTVEYGMQMRYRFY